MTQLSTMMYEIKRAVSCIPPHRIKDLHSKHLQGITTERLESIAHKLEIIHQCLTNQLLIRKTATKDLNTVQIAHKRKKEVKQLIRKGYV